MKNIKKRKLYFRLLKKCMKVKYKKPKFIFLGEKVCNSSLILSNHEGTDAPMSLEIYYDAPLRMWGTGEMNEGLRKLYKYQTKVYYHEKKHWNIHLARAFCLLASPLTNIFYSGLDLISTYQDVRFKTTIEESIKAIKQKDNIVIYPEVSDKGYLKELERFHEGFAVFLKKALKEGIDIPVFVSYFQKDKRIYIFDKPIMSSVLFKNFKTNKEIANYLLNKCNTLGKMNPKIFKIKRSK